MTVHLATTGNDEELRIWQNSVECRRKLRANNTTTVAKFPFSHMFYSEIWHGTKALHLTPVTLMLCLSFSARKSGQTPLLPVCIHEKHQVTCSFHCTNSGDVLRSTTGLLGRRWNGSYDWWDAWDLWSAKLYNKCSREAKKKKSIFSIALTI